MSGGPSRRLFPIPGRRRKPAADAAPLAREQAARLAALATGLRQLSHDLRGALSPALLAAERLQTHAEPAVQRSADVLVRAVDRAIALLHDQLGPLREGLPAAEPVAVGLREAVEAAIPSRLGVQHALAQTLVVAADPGHLRLAWQALFAHVLSLAAGRARLSVVVEAYTVVVTVEHDGRPQHPVAAADAVVQELAIARHLLRACGGDLATLDDGLLVATLRLA